MELDNGGGKRVFSRLGGQTQSSHMEPQSQKVCFHWRAGRCNRNPCSFRHSELPQQSNSNVKRGYGNGLPDDDNNSNDRSFAGQGFARRKPNNSFNSNQQINNKWGRSHGGSGAGGVGAFRPPTKVQDKVCHFWVDGKCSYGDKCRYLHQWFTSDSFTMLTQLPGHEKVISAIAFPLGSDKLYSGSKDESVRVWDCQTGQCAGVVNLGGEIGCMISEGPWIFVGIPNVVKAWNTQTNTDLSLSGPAGQVYALVVGNGMLFAGTQDGNILAWRFSATTNCFEPTAALKGHNLAVVTLVVGANRLYSGSMDNTIRVWDLETLQCIQTLTEHTSVVMSVLCWEQFLLTCSLDRTVKVWAATESGSLEVTYTHKEEHGVLALCGMHDAEAKPVLLCACNNNIVHLYDLPSFNERGKIFSKEEIRAIEIGPGGLFFTGDGKGDLRVWKWSETAPA
ncbi:Zinc finger ccch domain-containing protein [Thalictrum thalictroides]|uniref:Zinc finger ccch domain-containing protein n=1 Tax=Thalictrum thalictroides TaxID=46969 RepID=A0A7J6V9U5_THATH|nr:Zinc finger ccch domain-containing protein [Thalictrum thalictroides]